MNKDLKRKSIIRCNIGFVLFIVCAMLLAIVYFLNHGGENIRSDGKFYYEYFLRIFVDKELAGTGMIVYPIGTALLESPFLLAALFLSYVNGWDIENGMALCFHGAVSFAAFFYWALGMLFIYRLLRRKYTSDISVLSCICLTLGAMLPAYVIDLSSYSHAYGFFACSAFFCYVDYYERNRERPRRAASAEAFPAAQCTAADAGQFPATTETVVHGVFLPQPHKYDVGDFRRGILRRPQQAGGLGKQDVP